MQFAFNSGARAALGGALLLLACSRDRTAGGTGKQPVAAAPSSLAAPLAAPIPDDERQRIEGWLSFISQRDQGFHVFAIKPSGAAERQLSRGPGAHYNGPSSPDGTQLLITSVTESAATSLKEQRLYVLPLNRVLSGAEALPQLMPLGPPRPVVRSPGWSADGQQVVFEGTSAGYRDLFAIRRDGSELRQLTSNPEGNFEPSLSPQGEQLVFVSSRDRAAELYRARVDGSAPERLTRTPRDEWSPRFSADGSRIVFISDRDSSDRLYLCAADGSQVRRVSDLPPDSEVMEESPRFSPRETLLAYVVRRRGGRSELFVLDLATGSRHPVAASLGGEVSEPAWSPDARYLAFSAGKDRDQQIYLARRDGSGVVAVTTAAGPNWNPQWIAAPPRRQ